LTSGSAVPAAQSSYLTAAESYAAFVANSTTGVNSTARGLADSSAVTSVAFGARTLNNSSGTVVVSYGAGLSFANTPLGFYGATVTAQPANINVVSGLINVGLIASGTTYGVLPRSSQTLTTTASIAFGTLAGHSTSAGNVTVTGAAVGDLVMVGLPAVVSAGVIVQGVVFAANTVCMTAINGSNASKTVGTADYRITVLDY
jgi:hypothetical protein